jgi:hypothetical protein
VAWSDSLAGLTLSSATITGPSISGGTINSSTITEATLDRGMFVAPVEKWSIVGSAAPATTNVSVLTSSVLYYTVASTADIAINVRGDAFTTLNSLMSVGESITVGLLITNGTTAYRATLFQVDGSNITPKWQAGTAPTAGNPSAIDSYVLTVVKTSSSPTFTMLASLTQYA